MSDSRGRAGGAAQDWPAPIPLSPPTPDPLPLAPLPDWLRRHVRSVAEATQTPTDLGLMQGLAALSAALANKGEVHIRPGHEEPLLLWTVVVLPPASRKSAVHKQMVRPLYDYEAELDRMTKSDRQMAKHQRDVKEKGLSKAKKKLATAADDEEEGEAREQVRRLQEELNDLDDPTAPRLLASDVTAEGLTQLMARNHGRIAVLAPEGEIFSLMAGRYTSNARPNFDPHKRAWTGSEPIREDRIGREGGHVRRPALTLGICVQPRVFETLDYRDWFRGEGLLGRFLVAVPESGIGSRRTGADVPELDEHAARGYEDRLRTLLELEPAAVDESGEYRPHTLRFEDKARDVLYEFEKEVESMLGNDGALSSLRDWGGKLVGQCARVAGLLHAAKNAGAGSRLWDQRIRSSTMEGAVELAWALIPHARSFFDSLERDEDLQLARYVWKRITSLADRRELTQREVHRLCQGKAAIEDAEDLRSILGILEEHNLLRVEPQPSDGGRPPSPRIRVNPSASNGLGLGRFHDRSDRTPRYSPWRPSSVTSVRSPVRGGE